jgi:hypothetical protein
MTRQGRPKHIRASNFMRERFSVLLKRLVRTAATSSRYLQMHRAAAGKAMVTPMVNFVAKGRSAAARLMCGPSYSLISHHTFHLGMTLLAHTRVLMKRVKLMTKSQAIMERVATFLAFQWDDIGRRIIAAHMKEIIGYSGCSGAPKPNILAARKSGSGS